MCREVSSSSPVVWPASYAERSSSVLVSSEASDWCASASDWVQNVKCLDPYIGKGRMAFPCGKCSSCLANRRRIWTHRMMLESMLHEECSFVTLTYASNDVVSLEPKHLRLWLGRMRDRVGYGQFRFFACGEYGDKSGRPHYHAVLFGYAQCQGGLRIRGECQCRQCSVVRETWGYGHVMVAEFNIKTARYITGYVAKKMSHRSDTRLGGREPEFARMSLRPGIGANAVPDVASVMMQYRLEEKLEDVPTALRHGQSEMPLGRYLRKLLRRHVGLDEKAPDSVLEALRQGLLPVFDASEAVAPGIPYEVRKSHVREVFKALNEQAGRNSAARLKQRRPL